MVTAMIRSSLVLGLVGCAVAHDSVEVDEVTPQPRACSIVGGAGLMRVDLDKFGWTYALTVSGDFVATAGAPRYRLRIGAQRIDYPTVTHGSAERDGLRVAATMNGWLRSRPGPDDELCITALDAPECCTGIRPASVLADSGT
jgi:hypothetical protein